MTPGDDHAHGTIMPIFELVREGHKRRLNAKFRLPSSKNYSSYRADKKEYDKKDKSDRNMSHCVFQTQGDIKSSFQTFQAPFRSDNGHWEAFFTQFAIFFAIS